MLTIITVIALVIIAILSISLALWCEYKDGIFGHAALAVMGSCAILMLIGIWHGQDFHYNTLSVGMFIGMAVFLLRHAINAIRFRKRRE